MGNVIEVVKPIPSLWDMEDLSKRYVFQDHIAVPAFLRRNPQVHSSLGMAISHIERIWGTGTVVNVELSLSQDDETDTDALIAYIQTPDDLDVSIRKLSDFGASWWRGARSAVFGRLVFDVERCDAV